MTRQSFETFMVQRKEAALAYVQGDDGPVEALSTAHDPAIFFGPDGGKVEGADAVRKSFAKGAEQFGPESDSKLEVLDMAADENLAYWTGIQHATIKMRGKDKPVPMDLRITEVFRREHGAWKLIHRHADMLKS